MILSKESKKELRSWAREELQEYSPIMSWLVLEDGRLSLIKEPQGQSEYMGGGQVLAETGSFHKSHGCHKSEFRTQKEAIKHILEKIAA